MKGSFLGVGGLPEADVSDPGRFRDGERCANGRFGGLMRSASRVVGGCREGRGS